MDGPSKRCLYNYFLIAIPALLLFFGCRESIPSVCSPTYAVDTMEDIRQSELAVFFDATADTNLDSAEADLVRYSQKLWDSEIEIQHGPLTI